MNGSELKCYNIYYKHVGDLIDTSKNKKSVNENKVNTGELIEVYIFVLLYSIYMKKDNIKEVFSIIYLKKICII